ncbi:MAG: hypothetical protein U1E34_15295 [Amaricoccus sp.]
MSVTIPVNMAVLDRWLRFRHLASAGCRGQGAFAVQRGNRHRGFSGVERLRLVAALESR